MSAHSPAGSPSGIWGGSARSTSARSSGPKNIDPPRPAKDGFEWVWYPEGYWAERPLERRTSSKASSKGQRQGQQQGQGQTAFPVGKLFKWSPRSSRSPQEAPEPTEPPEQEQQAFTPTSPFSQPRLSQFMPPKNLPQSPYLSESAQIAALQYPTATKKTRGSRDTWKSVSPTSAPIAELISQSTKPTTEQRIPEPAWRSFHRHRVDESTPTAQEEPHPGTYTDAAPSYFTQKPLPPPSDSNLGREEDTDSVEAESVRESTPVPAPAPTITPRAVTASASRGLRKWLIMKIPRGHKGAASPNMESVTSSARERLVDAPSPASSAGGTFEFSREVHIPGSTKSYPGGEAMHVETPPLKQLTASGKPRSLFMDIKHPLPIEDESSNSSGSVGATPRVTPRVFSYRKGQQPEKKEWWDAPKATVRRDPVRDVSFFEFNMPEHLPNSPMCPANPKHKGKLRVCVYHGRPKQTSKDEGAAIAEEEDELDSPGVQQDEH